jgi:hypothetical protein
MTITIAGEAGNVKGSEKRGTHGKPWTYPRLVDRTISMDYKQEGETDGKKGHRTTCVHEGIQG